MITGKGKQHGHNVSFSQRRTKKAWSPNMQTKTVMVEGQKVRLKVSAKGIRTLKKKGALGQGPAGKPVIGKQITA
ncbi:50S ribosomal protein L28 [Candidatus Saccharibacteria bacterium]|nr:50S ribosomal protein L28 [Candidatus Saccharibacteria bacterium]